MLHSKRHKNPFRKGQGHKEITGFRCREGALVRSPYEGLRETLQIAVENFSDLKGILVEGNSAIEILKPDVVIFVSGTQAGKSKRSSEKILSMADVVIFDKKPPQGIPKSAKRFRRDEEEGFIEFVTGLIKEYEENT